MTSDQFQSDPQAAENVSERGARIPGTEVESTMRLGAYFLFAGAAFMAFGGILKRVTGADLDAALASGRLASYFGVVADQQVLIIVNLSAWIIGVLLLGAAGTALVHLCVQRRLVAQVALLCYWTGVPLAIASFVAWLALVVQIGPAASSEELAITRIVGWWMSRADWIATVLLVGIGPLLISVAGRDDWVPGWLAWWGLAAGIAGGVTIIAMIFGGLATYGQVSIPVGLGWTIAAGILLFQRAGTSNDVAQSR